MENPSSKNIRIGNANVGLIGLETAINQAQEQNLPEQEAVDFLLAVIQKKNYVPEKAVLLYRQALEREYKKRRQGADDSGKKGLEFRILGPGCVSCDRLSVIVINVLQKLNLAADVEHVTDLDEIWRYGVINTPALVINDIVKSSGRLPTAAEVEQWVREIMFLG